MLSGIRHVVCRSLLSSLVVLISLCVTVSAGKIRYRNETILPSTGTGPAYATACNNAWHSYTLASSSYVQYHGTVETRTTTDGGPWTSYYTYYANATTLCDRVARLDYSPAIVLSTSSSTGVSPYTATRTFTNSHWSGGPAVTPSCSILPSDCDPLWAAYTASLAKSTAAFARGNLSMTYGVAQVTQAPVPMMLLPQPLLTPHCANRSAVAKQSSAQAIITECGACTIYGQDVQLVYFPVPTTVSRDMCASTPLASRTYYNSDAIIELFAGKNYSGKAANTLHAPTAVVDQHTFTSGTAYISIATVWAADRCRKQFGQVSDVILAMPSSSVLSLRYSQDHFQFFFTSTTQTGYPVSYADFNEPVPWSAYNGQAICRGPYIGYPCSVIYKNQFFPQLAIPPGIRDLKPEWSTCQMWYGGLYDPPMALQPQTDVDRPTTPAGWDTKTPTSTTPGITTKASSTDIDGITRPAVPGSTQPTIPSETASPQTSSTVLSSATFVQRVLTTITTTKTVRGSKSNVLTVEVQVETVTMRGNGELGETEPSTTLGVDGGNKGNVETYVETISGSVVTTRLATAGSKTTIKASSAASTSKTTSSASVSNMMKAYDAMLLFLGGFLYLLMTVI